MMSSSFPAYLLPLSTKRILLYNWQLYLNKGDESQQKKEVPLKTKILVMICLFMIMSFLSASDFSGNNLAPNEISAAGHLLLSEESEVVEGLKEALSLGTKTAIQLVSQEDGYFGNEIIKILMPEDLRKVTDTLSRIGLQQQVDEFILSMNRSAEKAAPGAIDIFVEAIKAMTFEDATGILTGGDTAATNYFKEKISDQIYETFKPIISISMSEVGVTQAYKELSDKYASLPLMSAVAFDIDDYVTNKALDGLFYMVGEEEKKIRTDPAARATDLLKKIFK